MAATTLLAISGAPPRESPRRPTVAAGDAKLAPVPLLGQRLAINLTSLQLLRCPTTREHACVRRVASIRPPGDDLAPRGADARPPRDPPG
jgi:hypothetical protein